jgi:hypothetical protein
MEKDYTNNEFKRYATKKLRKIYTAELTEGWQWLNENTKRANIAYTGRPLPFPLYGSKLKNNVYYVSVNEVEPAWLHCFPNSELIWNEKYSNMHSVLAEDNNYRGKPSLSAWKKNLKQRNIEYLVVYPLHQINIFPIEDNWAKSNPNIFELLFSNDKIRIYKVRL